MSRGDDNVKGMRLALFGGSFDPPHRGHIAVAHAAAEIFGLASVLFTPTALQPLKPTGASATYTDRIAMVSLVCASEPRFSVSELDAPRADGKPNYTVDTLEALRSMVPDARIFAIAGADSFLELPRWHGSERLLHLAEWIVVSRPGFELEELPSFYTATCSTARVHLLETVQETVSATQLRARLARGEDCSDSVPGNVLSYIRAHHLYR